MSAHLRALPSVDRLLREAGPSELAERYGRVQVLEAARELLVEWRSRLQTDGATSPPGVGELAREVERRVADRSRPLLRRALNATGVVIHTNLGRAPLSADALAAVQAIGVGYSNLEYDLDQGQRGSRHDLVTAALSRLSGAEAALVVNNNAAAVLLVLSCFAQGREVVVSRGQLVEIGGGFRIPDVLRQSGARLVEVGSTNRTYAADFAAACGDETAALLRVHSSNYRVIGFVHEPTLAELAEVAHQRGLLLIDDLGSGSFLDTAQYGLAREPMVQESVAQGADLVCFSGDKLLGGPQCGLIVGRREPIGRLKRHPLVRAIRPDKLTLAALGATLGHYLREEAPRAVPVWRMISALPEQIGARATCLVERLAAAGQPAEVVDGASAIGGGSLPGETLPTRLLSLRSSDSAARLAARLRGADPPVVARVERDAVLLDLRTILPEEDELLLEALLQVVADREQT